MDKRITFIIAAFFLIMSSATISMADNSIITSLKEQGVSYKIMDDAALDRTRGSAIIYGQPYPSVVWGLKTHHVTYIGWGSEFDYNSYNYIGYGYDPNGKTFTYEGYTYLVGGDQWWADRTSDPDEWNAAYADLFEYHYQILYPDTQQPSPYAFRETIWNRPITLFSW